MESKYLVSWWEENNDEKCDHDQEVIADSPVDAVFRVRARNPLARKLVVKLAHKRLTIKELIEKKKEYHETRYKEFIREDGTMMMNGHLISVRTLQDLLDLIEAEDKLWEVTEKQ